MLNGFQAARHTCGGLRFYRDSSIYFFVRVKTFAVAKPERKNLKTRFYEKK